MDADGPRLAELDWRSSKHTSPQYIGRVALHANLADKKGQRAVAFKLFGAAALILIARPCIAPGPVVLMRGDVDREGEATGFVRINWTEHGHRNTQCNGRNNHEQRGDKQSTPAQDSPSMS